MKLDENIFLEFFNEFFNATPIRIEHLNVTQAREANRRTPYIPTD